MDSSGSRRERLRDATLREIKDTARERLRTRGAGGVSLRAIARDMGMTAPALYRYFASLDALIAAMIEDYKNELGDALEATRDALPEDDVAGRLYAVVRTFRRWALDHAPEFTLAFGPPIPGYTPPPPGADEAGSRFGGIFLELFHRQWLRRPFPVPDTEDIPAPLRRQLESYASTCGIDEDVPLGLLRVFAGCWVRLYGLVTMESFGHTYLMSDDGEPLFEAELADIAAAIGVDVPGA